MPAFEDYNIQEVFEIINEQKIENYSLIEESGKYSLNIKFIILKKEKIIKINLEKIEKPKGQIISELQNIKNMNKLKLIKLNETYNKILQDLKELEEEKKELENQAKRKTGNNSYINKDTNNSSQNNDNNNN